MDVEMEDAKEKLLLLYKDLLDRSMPAILTLRKFCPFRIMIGDKKWLWREFNAVGEEGLEECFQISRDEGYELDDAFSSCVNLDCPELIIEDSHDYGNLAMIFNSMDAHNLVPGFLLGTTGDSGLQYRDTVSADQILRCSSLDQLLENDKLRNWISGVILNSSFNAQEES